MQVTIKQAATLLGCSQDTIKRKIRRGELIGVKEPRAQGYTWLVQVDGPVSTGSGPVEDQPSAEDLAAVATTFAGEQPSSTPLPDPTVRALEQTIEVLRGQVQEQQIELDARRREVGELHVLLQTAQRALAAPMQGTDAPPEHATVAAPVHAPLPVHWWRWIAAVAALALILAVLWVLMTLRTS